MHVLEFELQIYHLFTLIVNFLAIKNVVLQIQAFYHLFTLKLLFFSLKNILEHLNNLKIIASYQI